MSTNDSRDTHRDAEGAVVGGGIDCLARLTEAMNLDDPLAYYTGRAMLSGEPGLNCLLYDVQQVLGDRRAAVEHMVQRFLGWRLPADFNPDDGISFKPMFNEHTDHPMRHEPTGTNLFDYGQATAMVQHMIDGLAFARQAAVSPASQVVTWDELERLAEAATPGPWETSEGGDVGLPGHRWGVGYPPRQGTIASLYDGEYIENPNATADSAFIAAANPAAVLELIAAARAGAVGRSEATEPNHPTTAGGWQDIATAPKDGARVIGLTKFGVEVVKWLEWDGAEYGPRTGWIGVEQDSTCYPESYLRAVATYQPTHWMPLPQPPATDGGE